MLTSRWGGIEQGRGCLFHPDLAGRERGVQEELHHAWILFRRHVEYVNPRATHVGKPIANVVAVMSLAVTYLPMFLPPPGSRAASGTEAPAPVPVA